MNKSPMKYYSLFRSGNFAFGVGYTPNGLYPTLRWEETSFDNWVPVTFELRDGILTDYLVNDLGWVLCSERLKSIIDQHASPKDNYEWLENIVIDPHGVRHTYYALHIPDRPDVLDEDAMGAAGSYGHNQDGTFDKRRVIWPIFSRNKIDGYRVVRARHSPGIFLAEPIVKAIKKAKCTGMKFKIERVV